MSELTRIAALTQCHNLLERKSEKLSHIAYNNRYEYAYNDWHTYRKVYSRLNFVKKQIRQECTLEFKSQKRNTK